MLAFVGIIAGLAVALAGAAGAGLSFDRKALAPLAGWSALAVSGWGAALAAAATII